MNFEQESLKILKQYWGYDNFRPLQQEIILSVLNNKDTFAILPTGGGKSICFQVPALIKEGLCLIISPLISLMKDQVDNLHNKGIEAEALYTGQSKKQQNIILERAVSNELKFLYISPERLASNEFLGWLKNMQVSLISVDESHCISQWGYDFRPEYLRIAEAREIFPDAPILAVTASATKKVSDDIIKSLEFKKDRSIFKGGFYRPNLIYACRKTENSKVKIIEICNKLKGCGIVYCRTRKDTEEISTLLKKNNHSADFYHAGLDTEERIEKQNQWIENKIRIIVCTNAFGMGIDKPDVRFVIHNSPPDCIESYYQEAGRAGRDGKKSYCILCWKDADFLKEEEKISKRYPDKETLKRVYNQVCNFLGIMIGSGEGANHNFDLIEFSNTYDIAPITAYNSISTLQRQGYLILRESGITESSMQILTSPSELYHLQVKNKKYHKLFQYFLRSRGGYFDFLTPISEYSAAVALEIPQYEITKMLRQLHRSEVIDYIERTNMPQLSLLEPRMDGINPDQSLVNFLKARAEERLESIKDYVTDNRKCRSQIISKYFDDNKSPKCNKCDNCLDNNRKGVSEEEFEQFYNYIRDSLTKEKQNIHKLKSGIGSRKLNKFIIAFDWMLQKEWVKVDKEGIAEWNRKGK